MPNVVMTIKVDGRSANLYQFPSFEEYNNFRLGNFNRHEHWRRLTEAERVTSYEKALFRHLRWQGKLIKAFMGGRN